MQILGNLPRGWKVHDRQTGSIAPDGVDLAARLRHSQVKVVAVRHGQSQVNAQAEEQKAPILCGQVDSPLTPKGRTQADAAADKIYQQLGGDGWLQQAASQPQLLPKLFCGPLSRARDTAQATSNLLTRQAEQLKLQGLISAHQAAGLAALVQPQVDQRLTEMAYGDYELKPLAQLQQDLPGFSQRWDGFKGQGIDFLHRFPQGESRADVMTRVADFLEELPQQYPSRTVLIFCHLETIAAAQTDLGLTPIEQGHTRINAGAIQNATPLNLI